MGRAGALSLLALAPLLLVAGCGGSDGVSCTTVSAPAPDPRLEPAPTAPLDTSKTYTVTFETSCGDFTVTLDPRQSPNAAASVYSLARRGFYDGTVVHRIGPTLFEAGDRSGTGHEGPGYTTLDEPPSDASYRRGTVAMAKTGGDPAGTGGSRFFVVTARDAAFAPDFAVVGKVSDGLDVIEGIGELGGPDEQPTQVVVIDRAVAEES